jgi:hypothetical protein
MLSALRCMLARRSTPSAWSLAIASTVALSPLMSSRISISSSRCVRPIASSLTAAPSDGAIASRVAVGGRAPISDGAGRVGTLDGAADQ